MLIRLVFVLAGPTDGPTDGQTDGPTDRVTYRVACTRLKIILYVLQIFPDSSGLLYIVSLRLDQKIVGCKAIAQVLVVRFAIPS